MGYLELRFNGKFHVFEERKDYVFEKEFLITRLDVRITTFGLIFISTIIKEMRKKDEQISKLRTEHGKE